MNEHYRSGFVNIFGAPNAGKSTLLNALLGENLVITSPKVQTTRHRIMGILTEENYQIIFSDTPGIIDPQYNLHKKMMMQVKSALEDADVAILVHDITLPMEEMEPIVSRLNLKVPCILLLNKADLVKDKKGLTATIEKYKERFVNMKVLAVSAKTKKHVQQVLDLVLELLPEAPPYYPDEGISDRPVRFFVSELIRQQIYELYHEEIPYHTAVLVQSFEEKQTLDVIKADIIVSRETQKGIIIGKNGTMIKQLGINARMAIEGFLQKKVHLELFVKVRPKWRDNENYLKEYGYN